MGRKPKQTNQAEEVMQQEFSLDLNLSIPSEEVPEDKVGLTKEVLNEILEKVQSTGAVQLSTGLVQGIVTEADLNQVNAPTASGSGNASLDSSALQMLLEFSKADGEALARSEKLLTAVKDNTAAVVKQLQAVAEETSAVKSAVVGFNSLVEAISSVTAEVKALKESVYQLKVSHEVSQEALRASLSSLNVVANPNCQEVSKQPVSAPQAATDGVKEDQLPWEDPKPKEPETRGLLFEDFPPVAYNAVLDGLQQLNAAHVNNPKALEQTTVEKVIKAWADGIHPERADDTPEVKANKLEVLRPQARKALEQLFQVYNWGTGSERPQVNDDYKSLTKKEA